LLKSFRYLLLPFSFLYSGILWIRNWLFDKDYIKSASFNLPVICVGNLAVGGTGKTPMVEYLINILQNNFNIATLSRGYGRMTKGFGIADEATTALEIGDEPMQFHQKFPKVTVAVGEERLVAIPQLLHEKPTTEVIILDDAFQHRHVRAGLNILLTDYKNLYTRDFVLPGGDLRDIKQSACRAHIIVVTKCDHSMSAEESNMLIKELNPLPGQSVFFTEILYTKPYHLFNSEKTIDISNDTADILLVCGIADPKAIKEFLTDRVKSYDMLRYADHHIFTLDDLTEIKKQFNRIKSDKKYILTTEKDAVRLQKFENDLKEYPIYVLPIRHSFMFNTADKFQETITGFIRSYPRSDLV
jgi:tetraacyldisaccharide 4'-kinase